MEVARRCEEFFDDIFVPEPSALPAGVTAFGCRALAARTRRRRRP